MSTRGLAEFANSIRSYSDPKEAENHLLSKGRGNEIAGYCFTTKYEELTELEIRHRRSVAAGLQRSADVIAFDRDSDHDRLPEPGSLAELPLAAANGATGGGEVGPSSLGPAAFDPKPGRSS